MEISPWKVPLAGTKQYYFFIFSIYRTQNLCKYLNPPQKLPLGFSIDHSDSYWPELTTFWHIDRGGFNRFKPLVKTGAGFDHPTLVSLQGFLFPKERTYSDALKYSFFQGLLPIGKVWLHLWSQLRSQTVFLLTSNLDYFTPTFWFWLPTFSKVPIEKYGKTPIFSGKQHFYSYFQNPSENSDRGVQGTHLNDSARSCCFFVVFFLRF